MERIERRTPAVVGRDAGTDIIERSASGTPLAVSVDAAAVCFDVDCGRDFRLLGG